MECDICAREFVARRSPLCVSCAQVILYEPRIHQASALLDRENAHTHVEAIVRPGNDGVLAALPQDADWDAIANGIKQDVLQRQRLEVQASNGRIDVAIEQANILRRQIEDFKLQIERQKKENGARRLEIVQEKAALSHRHAATLEPLETSIRKTTQRLQKSHTRAADAKAHLCYNASLLVGLSQERDARGKFTGRIMLGGLHIPDLREINDLENDGRMLQQNDSQESESQQHHHINSCLDYIGRLIGIWCHYLSIKVPAEIILPHDDFPHCAMLPEKSSYKGRDLPYPGGSTSHSTSPAASRLLQGSHNIPRARLLHLDRPLAKLAKDDPKTFGLFVEGAMLLAWDVAWLCKTQGVNAINTFDEVCDVGRSLWLLFRASQSRGISEIPQRLAPPNPTNSPSKAGRTAVSLQNVTFGTLTHGSVQHSLVGYEGAASMHNWRLAQSHRLVDKLRNFLLTEITGAEWDVLSEKDFNDEREDEVPVLVGGTRRASGEGRRSIASVMSVAPPKAVDEKLDSGKGWMKIRGRDNEF